MDFETGVIEVRNDQDFLTKSGNERSVPLVGDALTVLARKHVAAGAPYEGFVFSGVGGGRLNASFASKTFKRYVRLAKLPERIRFHSLRHTCASWLVQRGVALPVVQAILGHSNIRETQRYAHLAPDVIRSAMKAALGHGLMESEPFPRYERIVTV